MPAPAYKRCTKCGVEKTLDGFFEVWRNPKKTYSPDSPTHRSICKECCRAKDRANYAKDPQPHRERRRKTHEANLERENERSRRRLREGKPRAVDPVKARCRNITRNAVAAGKLIKSKTCEDCGAEPPKRLIHAHHHDYSKPFDVEWLCWRCHGKRHRADAGGEE